MSYFELHVTVGCSDREALDKLCLANKFKVAEFIMRNNKTDIICTAKSDTEESARSTMVNFLYVLKQNDVKPLRYKIEHVIMDSKHNPEVTWL